MLLPPFPPVSASPVLTAGAPLLPDALLPALVLVDGDDEVTPGPVEKPAAGLPLHAAAMSKPISDRPVRRGEHAEIVKPTAIRTASALMMPAVRMYFGLARLRAPVKRMELGRCRPRPLVPVVSRAVGAGWSADLASPAANGLRYHW